MNETKTDEIRAFTSPSPLKQKPPQKCFSPTDQQAFGTIKIIEDITVSPYTHESPRVVSSQLQQKDLKFTTIPAFDETIPTLTSGDCDIEEEGGAVTDTSNLDWDDSERIEEYVKK